jgi:hypothetical protein
MCKKRQFRGEFAWSLFLLCGCGVAHDKQVIHPDGVRREAEVRTTRTATSRAPIVNLRVDDRAKPSPTILGD